MDWLATYGVRGEGAEERDEGRGGRGGVAVRTEIRSAWLCRALSKGQEQQRAVGEVRHRRCGRSSRRMQEEHTTLTISCEGFERQVYPMQVAWQPRP